MPDELKLEDFQTRCLYNRYIVCTDSSKCARCGWCPDVAEARLDRIKASMSLNREKITIKASMSLNREKITIILLKSTLPAVEVVSKLRELWEGYDNA